jgi:hypothetical protein
MGYGSAWIRNGVEISPYRMPVEIDLVFTAYPVDTARWLLNYSRLMNARLEALFTLVPALRKAPVRWNLVGTRWKEHQRNTEASLEVLV